MFENMNGHVIREMGRLEKEGYKLILLSGCYDYLLERIGEKLGFDMSLGSVMEFENGYLNYDLYVITGERKKERLFKSLDEEINWKDSYAFADSHYDMEILSLVGNPVCVDPDDKLRNIALEKGWPIISKEE